MLKTELSLIKYTTSLTLLKDVADLFSKHEIVKDKVLHISENLDDVLLIRCSWISREVQLQLFKRSFSTKGAGRGIGTYSMKLLGEKYLKGKVWFQSSPEKGTTFFIAIPQKTNVK
jgi:sensor histidine kinase regulating citrate/malate metabolism